MPQRLPETAAVRDQIERLLALPAIRRSPNSLKLLAHLGERLLQGRPAPGQYELATEVMGLGRDFDPDANPLIRMQAGRLRRALQAHADGAGLADPVRILLPAGSYALTADSPAAPAVGRLVVRPLVALAEFRAIGLGPSQAHLPSVLAEELALCLGGISGLRVHGPLSRARLDQDHLDVAAAARRAGADLALDGSLQAADDGLVVRLRLLDAPTGEQLWSSRRHCADGPCQLAEMEGEFIRQMGIEIGEDFGVIDRHLSDLAKVKPEAALSVGEAVALARTYLATYAPELRDRSIDALRHACDDHPAEPLPPATLVIVLASLVGDHTWRQPWPKEEMTARAAAARRLAPDSPWTFLAVAADAWMRRSDDDLVRVADRVAAMPHLSPIVRGGVGLWLLVRSLRHDTALGWLDEAFGAHPHQPTGYHMGRMCAQLLAKDAEGLSRTLSDFGHAEGWVRPLMEGVVAAWRGDRAAAADCLQRLQRVDPTVASHGLARFSAIMHEDYQRAVHEAFDRVNLRLPATIPLP